MAIMTLPELIALKPVVEDMMTIKYAEVIATSERQQFIYAAPPIARREFTYRFLYDTIRLKEKIIGQEPDYEQTTGNKFNIRLTMWETAVSVDMYDFDEADVPSLVDNVGAMADAFDTWNYLRQNAILTGGTASFGTEDGQPLFSSTHNRNGNTYDNLVGPLTADAAGYVALRTLASQFPSDRGEPLGLMPNWIWSPMAHESGFKQLQGSQYSSTPNLINPFQGQFNLLLVPELTAIDANDFYSIYNTPNKRAFVRVTHKSHGNFKIVPEVDDQSEAVRRFQMYRWWARALMVMWVLDPRQFVKVVN